MLPELKFEIVRKMIPSSDSIEEAISSLKTATIFCNVNYEHLFKQPQKMNKLMDILYNKFGSYDNPKELIAEKIGTENALNYYNLNSQFINFIKQGDIDNIKEMLNKGADVNYSFVNFMVPYKNHNSILSSSTLKSINYYSSVSKDIIILLLAYGMKPFDVYFYQECNIIPRRLRRIIHLHLLKQDLKLS